MVILDNLARALRLFAPQSIALTGAGGKTTGLFWLAAELGPRVLLASSTHLGQWQLQNAAAHHVVLHQSELEPIINAGINGSTLLTGPIDGVSSRSKGLPADILEDLHRWSKRLGLALVIEADGSRRRPLKAPADHEPVIPPFVDVTIVCCGLSAIMERLTEDTVYGSERFADISGLKIGDPISIEALASVLLSPHGGLKGIPESSRRIALMNQADTAELRQMARKISRLLLEKFGAVAVASLGANEQQTGLPSIGAVYERCAAVILAAGSASRMGRQKMLLPWNGEAILRRVVRTTLESMVEKVIVVTGANAPEVQAAVQDLPVEIAYNPEWQEGQGKSVVAGVRRVPPDFGSVVFVLGDQPRIVPEVIDSIIERHANTHALATAPFAGGRRRNPVLFDRELFPRLLTLRGDIGGRQLLDDIPIERVEWDGSELFQDIDTPDDYDRLREG